MAAAAATHLPFRRVPGGAGRPAVRTDLRPPATARVPYCRTMTVSCTLTAGTSILRAVAPAVELKLFIFLVPGAKSRWPPTWISRPDTSCWYVFTANVVKMRCQCHRRWHRIDTTLACLSVSVFLVYMFNMVLSLYLHAA